MLVKNNPKKSLGKKPNKTEVKVVKEDSPYLLEIISAIHDFTDLLNAETSVASSGQVAGLDAFLPLKKDMDTRLKRVTRAASENGYSLVLGTEDAVKVEKELEKLREASLMNAEALQGAKNALDHIKDLMKKASSERGSEGMYGRNASKVAAPDKKMLGFETQI